MLYLNPQLLKYPRNLFGWCMYYASWFLHLNETKWRFPHHLCSRGILFYLHTLNFTLPHSCLNIRKYISVLQLKPRASPPTLTTTLNLMTAILWWTMRKTTWSYLIKLKIRWGGRPSLETIWQPSHAPSKIIFSLFCDQSLISHIDAGPKPKRIFVYYLFLEPVF